MPNPHGYTLGERMRRAKGARRAVLIAEERQQKARWLYHVRHMYYRRRSSETASSPGSRSVPSKRHIGQRLRSRTRFPLQSDTDAAPGCILMERRVVSLPRINMSWGRGQ